MIVDDEGNGQIVQSESVLTTLERDDDHADPSLIIHVPKEPERPPEKHKRTIFWAALVLIMLTIGLGTGVGFGYLINEQDEIVIAPPIVKPPQLINVTLDNGIMLIGEEHPTYSDTVVFKNIPYAGLLMHNCCLNA